jgi:hypothetical protein
MRGVRPVALALVLLGAACSSQAPEPPEPFVPHDLVIEDFPHCPGGGAFARAFVIKVLEPARERQMKEVFLRAPKAHKVTVDKRKQTVEVRFGICAEPVNLDVKQYRCEAPTMRWYASVPVEIDPAGARSSFRFAMPPEPVPCQQGTAILKRLGGV